MSTLGRLYVPTANGYDCGDGYSTKPRYTSQAVLTGGWHERRAQPEPRGVPAHQHFMTTTQADFAAPASPSRSGSAATAARRPFTDPWRRSEDAGPPRPRTADMDAAFLRHQGQRPFPTADPDLALAPTQDTVQAASLALSRPGTAEPVPPLGVAGPPRHYDRHAASWVPEPLDALPARPTYPSRRPRTGVSTSSLSLGSAGADDAASMYTTTTSSAFRPPTMSAAAGGAEQTQSGAVARMRPRSAGVSSLDGFDADHTYGRSLSFLRELTPSGVTRSFRDP